MAQGRGQRGPPRGDRGVHREAGSAMAGTLTLSERQPAMTEPVAEPARGPVELPPRVTIREVGPRDGLQSEDPMSVHDRAGLIDMLGGANLPKIEAVSFVSPKAVPAMADAAEVWKLVRKRPEVRYSALVPNRRGAEAALEAGGFSSLQGFLAASEGYNEKNVGKSVDESIEDVRAVVDLATGAGVPVEVSISSAFGDA